MKDYMGIVDAFAQDADGESYRIGEVSISLTQYKSSVEDIRSFIANSRGGFSVKVQLNGRIIEISSNNPDNVEFLDAFGEFLVSRMKKAKERLREAKNKYGIR